MDMGAGECIDVADGMASCESGRLSVPTEQPGIKAVRPDRGRTLVVTWKTGGESIVDVLPHIVRYAVFKSLVTDDALFRQVRVGEWGWCTHWTEEMEISADTLWRLALDQGAASLRAWRAAHGLTQEEAADALGISARMWRYYEAGTHLLPKTVRLAAVGLDAQAHAA